jgi:hypothetical protein
MRRRFLLSLGLTAAVSALSATSCLSPTLPLPPPDTETGTQSMDDPTRWVISGTCAPGALVIVMNDATGQGAVYEDRSQSGHFLVEIEGERCDSAWVSQERGSEVSSRGYFILDTFSPNMPNGSGQCQ